MGVFCTTTTAVSVIASTKSRHVCIVELESAVIKDMEESGGIAATESRTESRGSGPVSGACVSEARACAFGGTVHARRQKCPQVAFVLLSPSIST